jgi:3',5'-cyclic AMP phosphodiesterase CpdA
VPAFSFVQVSDHHLTAREDGLTRGFSPAYSLRAVLRDIASRVGDGIEFVLSTGDLVEPASAEAYGSARALLGLDGEVEPAGAVRLRAEGLDLPAYLFPGNHDEPALLFGRGPAHTSFEHDGVRFVWVDWGRDGRAAADGELFAFLEHALADGRPTIVVTHHHLVPLGARWLDQLLPAEPELDRFFEIVAGGRVLAILSGHAHTTYEQTVAGLPVYGIAATSFQFALTDEPLLTLEPPAYRVVTVDDGGVTTRVYQVPLPD